MIISLRAGFFFVLIFFSGIVLAQDCNCIANFDSMVNHVTDGYAGFPDKVTKTTQADFNIFTKQLRQKALTVYKTGSCYLILRAWTNYFQDRHLRLQPDWGFREKILRERIRSVSSRKGWSRQAIDEFTL